MLENCISTQQQVTTVHVWQLYTLNLLGPQDLKEMNCNMLSGNHHKLRRIIISTAVFTIHSPTIAFIQPHDEPLTILKHGICKSQ